ncbi:MAG: hypothetical protein FIB01_06455 [Gemmatimonadetes bacterium]|nr:hypothetical protein [Gemmatimonadota bacterium]
MRSVPGRALRRARPLLLAPLLLLAASVPSPTAPRFTITLPSDLPSPVDGRLLLLISTDTSAEPRFQISDGPGTQLVFGMDIENARPGQSIRFEGDVVGYPFRSLADLPDGRYRVQALLNRYRTYRRADGHVVKLPPDMGEGQQWASKPGNRYSTPRWLEVRAGMAPASITLDQEIPAIAPPADTKWVKHVRLRSERLSAFWGTDVYLGAHVLLPAGFEEHPNARYPLVIDHGHFPADFTFVTEPPDTTVPCVYSERFRLDCYNRITLREEYQFFKDWTAADFPRVLLVQIQHPTPYYDDSYAVNSENNGPYGDAIQYELIPYLEKTFRGLGEGWARFTYGGSTGGWEAMAVQVFYPEQYNGAWIACPDPIDFRAYTVVNIYEDRNAYWLDSRWKQTPRPAARDWLGHVSYTIQENNLREAALGSRGRSGDQWDIWQAVYSPAGEDGYPQPIWDKLTGTIDRRVSEHWQQNYDLSYILRRDWATLGPKLVGKLNIYVGDMDTYYLNNAVYLVEDFLERTTNPYYAGEVKYGDRAEHCWNGDPTRPNAISRLRYAQMFIPRIPERVRKNSPAGADTASWRY